VAVVGLASSDSAAMVDAFPGMSETSMAACGAWTITDECRRGLFRQAQVVQP